MFTRYSVQPFCSSNIQEIGLGCDSSENEGFSSQISLALFKGDAGQLEVFLSLHFPLSLLKAKQEMQTIIIDDFAKILI